MDELKFDKMEVDTKLAQEFLKKHSAKLAVLAKPQNSKLSDITDGAENDTNSTLDQKLALLAKKVDQNAELFAQLEALKRGSSKHDVKYYDIKIIVQCYKYWSKQNIESIKHYCLRNKWVHLYDKNPLFLLGHFARLRKQHPCVVFVYDDTTLPSCLLFALLCAEAGFGGSDVTFIHRKNPDISWVPRECPGGTVLAVAERADVDSAVDAVLASTTAMPWAVRRMFVQESVYAQVKRALAWKCGLRQGGASAPFEVHTLVHDDKTFLFDHLEDVDDISGHFIIVEAYRTAKELLALIKKHPPVFLSLWASDVAESHEIALAAAVPLVWVNDLGSVDGPDNICNIFLDLSFPPLDFAGLKRKLPECEKINKTWAEMSVERRVDTLVAALEEYLSQAPESRGLVEQIKMRLSKLPSNKFVEIAHGKMWIGIENSAGVAGSDYLDANNLLESVVPVVYGGWANLRPYEKSRRLHSDLVKFLNKKGLPYSDFHYFPRTTFYTTRCISINYGTIFSN